MPGWPHGVLARAVEQNPFARGGVIGRTVMVTGSPTLGGYSRVRREWARQQVEEDKRQGVRSTDQVYRDAGLPVPPPERRRWWRSR